MLFLKISYVSSATGVIRWMGVDIETNFTLVGIELEDELPLDLPLTLTDGTHNGERFFKCSTDRAFFVPLERCRKDPRFQDGIPTTPVHQAAPNDAVRDISRINLSGT